MITREQFFCLIKKEKEEKTCKFNRYRTICKWNCQIKCAAELFLEVSANSPAYNQITSDMEVSRLILRIIQEIIKELAMVSESL